MEDKQVLGFIFVPAEQVETQDKLSARTIARLEKALQIHRKGEHVFFVVSGGIFNPPEIQTQPAGKLMKEWLIAQGINQDLVLVEDRSLDTYENIERSMALIGTKIWMKHFPFQYQGVTYVTPCEGKVVIVSDHWHLKRFKRLMVCSKIPITFEESRYKLGFLGIVKEIVFLVITYFDPEGEGYLNCFNRERRRQS